MKPHTGVFMKPYAKRMVPITPIEQLANIYYYLWIWELSRLLNEARRHWMDNMADVLYSYDGVFIDVNGEIWILPDIDDIMGDSDRWISAFLEEKDGKPRRISKELERIQLIDVYIRLAFFYFRK